jgi:hypothetical protein
MTMSSRLAVFAALGLGLAACANNPNVQPPVAGTTTGTAGQSAVRQAVDAIPQDQRQGTSAGAATFGGTAGGGEAAGRPTITRTGPGTGTVGGGIPQQYTPPITDRPRGGGG